MGQSLSPQDIARYIDHTLLKPEATEAQITRLCAEAREYGFASVCVNPTYVSLCAELLRGSPVVVCTVIGFPLGAHVTAVKVFETREALQDGASEVDMVVNIGAIKSGRWEVVADDIRQVVEAAHAGGALCKVILETALLSNEEKVRACMICKQAGADFVKTSTGFGPGGATVEDIALMRRTVGANMGVKASGGVRTYEETLRMISAGATRIGASAGVRIVQEAQGDQQSSAPDQGY